MNIKSGQTCVSPAFLILFNRKRKGILLQYFLRTPEPLKPGGKGCGVGGNSWLTEAGVDKIVPNLTTNKFQ